MALVDEIAEAEMAFRIGGVSLGYPSHEAIIAITVTAIAAVANQHITCSGNGSVNPITIDRRIITVLP
jgi:hypothetical protein